MLILFLALAFYAEARYGEAGTPSELQARLASAKALRRESNED
jgi:hypothetical protein